MISDRLLAWLQERLGYAATKWSIVRIAAVAVAGLLLASLVVPPRPGDLAATPYNAQLGTDTTRNVALPLGDTRGFAPTQRPGDYQIAWIGGSETMAVGSKTRAFIPQLVTDQIKTVDGRPVSTDIYYLNAVRLADELAALSSALAAKPDLVVVTLNPVWVMNDLAVQQWGYLDQTLLQRSIWPPSRWPVAASLVSPGDVGWKGLSWLSPRAVGERLPWGVDLADQTDALAFLEPVQGGVSSEPATGLQQLAERRPVDFWFSQFKPSNQGTSLAARQLGILERQVASTSSFNRTVLQQMFEMVSRAGVDAYFYMPPIDPTVYVEPDAQRYIAEVRSMLAAASVGRTGGRIVFDPQGLQDRVPPTRYRDIVHVLNGEPEATVLTEDLCALLVARGKQPGCEGS